MSGKKLSISEQRERAKQWALEEEKKKRQREDNKSSPTINVPKNKRAKLNHTPTAVQTIFPNHNNNNNNNNNKRSSTSSPINIRNNNRNTTAEEIDSPPKRRGRPPSPKEIEIDNSPKRRGRPPSPKEIEIDNSPKRRGRPPSPILEDSIKIQQELVKKRADERTIEILNEKGKNLTPSSIKKSSTPVGIIENQRTPIYQRSIINITSNKSNHSKNLEEELQTYNNAERQKSLSKNLAQVRKKEGNSFYKEEKYIEAIDKYSIAIELDETDISFYSNRSACYLALQRYEHAVEDGKKCLKLDKDYLKGYYRTGLGLIGLQKNDAALNILQQGLDLDPSNLELLKVVKDLKNHMSDTDDTTTTLLISKNYISNISPNPYDNTPNQDNRRFIQQEKSLINEHSMISIFSSKLKILLLFLLMIPFSSFRNALSTAFLIIAIYLNMIYGKEIRQTSFYLICSSPIIIIFYLYRRFKFQTSEKLKASQQVVESLAELAKEELVKVNSNGYYPLEHLKWDMHIAVNKAIQENIIPMTPMNNVLKYNKDRNYSKKLIEILWKDIIKEVERDPNIQPSTREYEGKISKCWKISGIRGRSPFPPFSSSSSSSSTSSGMFSFFS